MIILSKKYNSYFQVMNSKMARFTSNVDEATLFMYGLVYCLIRVNNYNNKDLQNEN